MDEQAFGGRVDVGGVEAGQLGPAHPAGVADQQQGPVPEVDQPVVAELDTYSPRRRRIAGDLQQALDRDELLVYFQPKANLTDRRIVGAEALVRWRHPELGLLPPDEFIPMAEQTGLITQLTYHVLRVALRDCSQWRRAGHDVGVAVNLAMRSLLDTSLPDTVDDLLRPSGVPPSRLTLEITESSIMGDPDRAIKVLEGLAARGVRLSVDDFGTGYSSLTYLQRLLVHEVKIDKSFVFASPPTRPTP